MGKGRFLTLCFIQALYIVQAYVKYANYTFFSFFFFFQAKGFFSSENPDIWISQWVPLGQALNCLLVTNQLLSKHIIQPTIIISNPREGSFICRTVCWQRCADWQERSEGNRDGETEMSRLTNEMDDRGIGHKCARYIIACSPGARAQWHRFICTKPALTRRLLKVS